MPVVARPSYSGDGRPSRPASPEDGREQIAPIPELEMRAGVRYIYYRLYTENGPLESHNPIYSNDFFISRISSRSVRPPQTASSLKKHLCKIEGITIFGSCTLYQSLSAQTPLEDSTHLSSRGTPAPGLSDLDPMAVVVDTHAAQGRSKAMSTIHPQGLPPRDYQQRYVYYVVYDEDGEAVSKTSFTENNPSLGRVNALCVPPPHIVSSLKNCLIKFEKIWGDNVQLFENEGSESAMSDIHAISLSANTFPGFLEDQPLAITYETEGPTTNISPVHIEDPTGILARYVREVCSTLEKLQESCGTHARSELTQVMEKLEEVKKEIYAPELDQARSSLYRLKALEESTVADAYELREAKLWLILLQARLEETSFTMRLKANCHFSLSGLNLQWHRMTKGDIFQSDGISRQERYFGTTGTYNYYLARRFEGGNLGIVFEDYVTLL